uniref:Ig-like domain-containing protein n=1 Tax=Xenopus tropicalis TaxID=8364 RepID=A0A1B8XUM6_XENTR
MSLIQSWVFCLLIPTCFPQKAVITQEPRSIIIGTGSAALMRCEQETTDYEWMFWYRQREGQGVQLVSSQLRGDQPTYEEGYRTGFHVNRTARDKISFLEIQVPKRQDQGVYLCAASDGTVTRPNRGSFY